MTRRFGRRLGVAGALAIMLALAVTVGWLAIPERGSSVVPPVVAPLVAPLLTPTPSDRLMVASQPAFLAGLNYPWKTGQDFGTGGWGHSGVSDPTTYQEVDADFANMAAEGVRVVKWRVFSDGRYGLQFDANGVVTGLDEQFFPDVDAALEIARRHDMYLVLTLFSSGLWTADCQSGSVRLGGQAATLTDPARRQALVERAIVPLLDHLAASDRVVAFETIAEPEWGVAELNEEQDVRIKLPGATLREFVDEVTRAIHQHTHSLATLESNRFSNMQNWQHLGLDYYSFSWYDWLEPYEPLATPASAANLDRPVVIGEYPASGSTYYTLPQVLDIAHSMGYAGAFGWSYWSGDGISRWRDVAPTFSTWVAGHWNDANLGGRAQPPAQGPITPQQYPYAFRDFALQVGEGVVVADMGIDVPSGEAYVPHAYLYQAGNPQPLEDVRLTAAPGQPGMLAARFTQAIEGPAYTVSLGIFDPAGSLRKWFNNVATFAIAGGALTTPRVDTLTTELGCAA
jgi:hypothetical protein